jgi:hypothetical protein
MGLSYLLDPKQNRDETRPHVSDLISKVLRENREPFDDLPEQVHNMMAMGRIWEAVVRLDVARAALDEGILVGGARVLEVDGIIGSLDGVLLEYQGHGEDVPVGLIEMKLKFSKAADPTENKRYMYQVKAYCWMLGVEYAWMPILALSARPPNAEYYIYKIGFSKLELEENWKMLVNMRDYDGGRK